MRDLAELWKAAYAGPAVAPPAAMRELAAETLAVAWSVERDIEILIGLLAAAGEEGLVDTAGKQPVKLVIAAALLQAYGIVESIPGGRIRLIPSTRRRLASDATAAAGEAVR